MTYSTLRIMAGLESRLNHLIDMEVSACGFDENLDKCDRYRTKIERWLAKEIEALSEKAESQKEVGGA